MQVGFLNFYGGVLDVRQERAQLIANNIANADTPNYHAVDVNFAPALAAALDPSQSASGPEYRADATVALNGNDVSLDGERVEAAQNGEAMLASATFLHQSTADLVMALRPNPSGG
jgi:flagellar basal-body rod protein FlgB